MIYSNNWAVCLVWKLKINSHNGLNRTMKCVRIWCTLSRCEKMVWMNRWHLNRNVRRENLASFSFGGWAPDFWELICLISIHFAPHNLNCPISLNWDRNGAKTLIKIVLTGSRYGQGKFHTISMLPSLSITKSVRLFLDTNSIASGEKCRSLIHLVTAHDILSIRIAWNKNNWK